MKRQQNPYKIQIGIIIFLIGFLFSCSKENRWDCIKRSGEQTTDIRTLPPFTGMYVNNNIDVFITQGPTQEVKVVAGKNLVSLVKTEVTSGALHISNENKCNWARSYKKGVISVYITIPVINIVENDGSGIITGQNTILTNTITISTSESGDIKLSLNANTTYIDCTGSSDITLQGSTSNLGIYHTNAGYIYCQNFPANIIWTGNYASGNEYLNGITALGATIGWAGDIYYTGNPQITQDKITVNGTGSLIHQN